MNLWYLQSFFYGFILLLLDIVLLALTTGRILKIYVAETKSQWFKVAALPLSFILIKTPLLIFSIYYGVGVIKLSGMGIMLGSLALLSLFVIILIIKKNAIKAS
jgi:hypothetical protein